MSPNSSPKPIEDSNPRKVKKPKEKKQKKTPETPVESETNLLPNNSSPNMPPNSSPKPIEETNSKKVKKPKEKKQKKTPAESQTFVLPNNSSPNMSPNSSSKPIEDTNLKKAKKPKEKKQKKTPVESENKDSISKKRRKSPGVRIVGGRIYDSENGKTCHQCRQKTLDFSAACTAQKNAKPCTLNFCLKCLLNRYGEKAKEVNQSGEWQCPKCRGICNCSFCMKKKGYQPTGILAYHAKASGYSSVSQLLEVKPPADITASAPEDPSGQQASVSGEDNSKFEIKSSPTSKTKKRKIGDKIKGNDSDGGHDDGPQLHKKTKKSRITTENTLNSAKAGSCGTNDTKSDVVAVPLPLGTDVTTVAGVHFSTEDVGHALQLLEFCKAFGEVLDLKQGQAESILEELTTECSRRRGQYSTLIQFHIQLLSFIRKDREEPPLSSRSSGNSWLQALQKCISESHCPPTEFPLDFFDRDGDGYEKLGWSKKLLLLNFLCDETLCTTSLRDWIDKQNLKLIKREKEAKEQIQAAKDKERQAKQKMQDEVAKAVILEKGAPITLSEREELVSSIKAEVAKAHAEKLEAMEVLPRNKQRSDAVRTEPLSSDGDGHTFWRLKGYSAEDIFLLQDIRNLDSDQPEDRWFRYDAEQTSAVEKYICSVRKKRRLQVDNDTLASGQREPGDILVPAEASTELDEAMLAPEEAIAEADHGKEPAPEEASLENKRAVDVSSPKSANEVTQT